MSPEAVKPVVEAEGFRLVRMVDLPPYHYGAVFELKSETKQTSSARLAILDGVRGAAECTPDPLMDGMDADDY
jgi:hypothetical protein